MATSKKTHTTRKTTAKKTPAKSASAKKSRKAGKARPLTWRFYVVTVGIFVIAVSTVVVISLLAASTIAKNTNKARLDRINTIYASLNVGNEYTPTYTNVFGDKRPYDYDKSRSASSQIDYVHGDTVNNTVAELDKKIKAAGFTFIDEPYPGGVGVQYHYKSAKNEYLRLTVESKPYHDAFYNAYAMDGKVPASVFAMDKNAGPSEVTIKVNLDDNNE